MEYSHNYLTYRLVCGIATSTTIATAAITRGATIWYSRGGDRR